MKQKNWKYTLEQLKEAVANSISYAGTIKYLGLNPYGGGGYVTIIKRIKENNIDTSHFKGQGWSKGRTYKSKIGRPIEEYLSNNVYIMSNKLKKKLYEQNVFENKCSQCKITEWNNKKLSMHLDHIDGNKYDNSLSNLRILCPNCHSQTETYCRSKQSLLAPKPEKKIKIKKESCNCINCNKSISNNASRCKSCATKQRMKPKIAWPLLNDLLELVKQTNYTQAGKILGVSDNAIRKHINKLC